MAKGATLHLPNYGAIAAAKPLFNGVLPASAVIGDTVGSALSDLANTTASNLKTKNTMSAFADSLQQSGSADEAGMVRAVAESLPTIGMSSAPGATGGGSGVGAIGPVMSLMMQSIQEKNRILTQTAQQNAMMNRQMQLSQMNHTFDLQKIAKEFELRSDLQDKMEQRQKAVDAQKATEAASRQSTGLDYKYTELGAKTALGQDRLAERTTKDQATAEQAAAETARKLEAQNAAALIAQQKLANQQAIAKIPIDAKIKIIGQDPQMNADYAKARKDAISEDKDTRAGGAARMKQIEDDASTKFIRGGGTATTPAAKTTPEDFMKGL